jgi:hypothetical protein
MRRFGWLLSASICAGLLTGCLDRRFVVTSDPPGAVVLVDGKPIGATPADDHFIYYGKRTFTLIKDGYQTLKVEERIKAPWYDLIGLDFFTENFVPLHLEDVRRFHYKMEPVQGVRSDQLLQDAETLKARAATIGPLEASRQPTPEAPLTPVPATQPAGEPQWMPYAEPQK